MADKKSVILKTFKYENNEFRVIDRNGEPWFIGSEACNHLSIVNVSDALARLDDDERETIVITEGLINQGLSNNAPGTKLIIISESGLYSLILTSRKPEAKPFKKWVTSEVLPSIRKTGSYHINDPLRVEARKIGVPTRKDCATTLIEHGVSKPPKGYGIVNITNRVSQNITGHTVTTLKRLFKIPKGKTPRDYPDAMDTYALLATTTTEQHLNDYVKGHNVRGDTKCLKVADEISLTVSRAFEMIKSNVKKIA